jgi:hypothetical protein
MLAKLFLAFASYFSLERNLCFPITAANLSEQRAHSKLGLDLGEHLACASFWDPHLSAIEPGKEKRVINLFSRNKPILYYMAAINLRTRKRLEHFNNRIVSPICNAYHLAQRYRENIWFEIIWRCIRPFCDNSFFTRVH